MRRLELGVGLAWAGLAVAGLGLGYDPVRDVDFSLGRSLPSLEHPLGTDRAGRDLLARLVDAAPRFLAPGALGAGVAAVLGVLLGAPLGWRDPIERGRGPKSGRLRRAGEAMVDGLLGVPGAVPPYVVLLLVGVGFGFDPLAIGLVAGGLAAAELAEALADRIRREREAEYVVSARAEGLSARTVLFRHLVWFQSRGLVARSALAVFPRVLLVEAALSCLPPGGFGVKEPTPSWGNMLVEPMQALVGGAARGAPSWALAWNALVPVAAVMGAVSSFAWLGGRLSRQAESAG